MHTPPRSIYIREWCNAARLLWGTHLEAAAVEDLDGAIPSGRAGAGCSLRRSAASTKVASRPGTAKLRRRQGTRAPTLRSPAGA